MQKTHCSLEKVAYVEMYVGNIFHSRSFFTSALKFQHVATRKADDVVTFLMKQGGIHILLTSSLVHDSPVARHVQHFGDSIKKISFWVKDVETCFQRAIMCGAKEIQAPSEQIKIKSAIVDVYNQVEHEFLEMGADLTLPGFEYTTPLNPSHEMIYNIDHIASCHPAKTINRLAAFYKEAFGFAEDKSEDIYSEESGMHITIMKSPNGLINLPLVEPSSDASPLHTYLQYNPGSGIHHVAFETDDIIAAVEHYEENLGELRKASQKYYDQMLKEEPNQAHNIKKLAPYGVMLEKDEQGVLFQIFTKPVVTRPTLFLEFVQRDKAEGFGTVNIQALYETLEE